jgi:YfiH family protein
MDVLRLQVPRWQERDGLLHGFLGRRGGKSIGSYASLNLSPRVGDDPQVVKDNVCDAKRAVGIHHGKIVTMKQMHGDRILEVREREIKEAGEGDAMVTQESRVFLAVLSADCVPILFTADGKRLAAVAHAGWRGTLAGIGPKVVRHIKERCGLEPAALEAALGPAIGPCCYEIGADVSSALIGKWGETGKRALRVAGGRQFLDLKRLNRLLLEEAGVPSGQIVSVGPCTSCAADDFFSYRREKSETGRQLSFIGWME